MLLMDREVHISCYIRSWIFYGSFSPFRIFSFLFCALSAAISKRDIIFGTHPHLHLIFEFELFPPECSIKWGDSSEDSSLGGDVVEITSLASPSSVWTSFSVSVEIFCSLMILKSLKLFRIVSNKVNTRCPCPESSACMDATVGPRIFF